MVAMTRWVWGYLYWGAGWLFCGFLVAELAGFYRVAPWPTLSETVWHASRYPLVAPLVFATLIFLGFHFLFHRPIVASIVFGLVVAFGAHLLDKSWP